MEILVCDQCYKRDSSKPVIAVDLIPQFQLGISRQKVGPIAVCKACLEEILPEEIRSTKVSVASSRDLKHSLPQISYGTPGYVDKIGLAAMCGVSTGGLDYYLHNGKIAPAARVGNANMYRESDAKLLADSVNNRRSEERMEQLFPKIGDSVKESEPKAAKPVAVKKRKAATTK